MPRVKRGRVRTKKRKALLSQTKGYRWGRKNLTKQAKTATKKAGAYALRDRRAKKRVNRRLWQTKLNAASREHGLKYSDLIYLMKKKNIALDRKVMADMAENNPQVFKELIQQIKA